MENFLSLPMATRYDPFTVTESGRPAYRDAAGNVFEVLPGQTQARPSGGVVNALAGHVMSQSPWDTARGAVNALAQGAWQGISAPGRALQGETVTPGDAWATALDWGVMSGLGSAPSGALRAGAPLRHNDNMKNPIFDKAARVADELRKTYGDAVEITTHPTGYGNSAYVRVKVPVEGGGAWTEAGFRLSDHMIGDRRKALDDFSTIIDGSDVTPETLLGKIQEDISAGLEKAGALKASRAAERAKKDAVAAAQMDLWKSLDQNAKSDFANRMGPLQMAKDKRPAVRAKQYWEAHQSGAGAQSSMAEINAYLKKWGIPE